MRVITIFLAIVTIFAGSMTMDAKTTKKKRTSRTTQTPTAQWNGDIPSAIIIEQFFFLLGTTAQVDKYRSQFIDHGYHLEDNDFAIKDGVCEITSEIDGETLLAHIIIYDSTMRQWLYKDMQNFVKSQPRGSCMFTYMEEDIITLSLSRFC